MDIKKLNEEIETILVENINEEEESQEIKELRKLLLDDIEVFIKVDGDVDHEEWDGFDPTTYGIREVPGMFRGYVYVDQKEDGTWSYHFTANILEEVYAGTDEDGYPDYDLVDTGDQLIEGKDGFKTKEEAVEAFIKYIYVMGEVIDVGE